MKKNLNTKLILIVKDQLLLKKMILKVMNIQLFYSLYYQNSTLLKKEKI